LVVALALGAGLGATPAFASSLQAPTVSLSSTAGGIQHVTYTVGFATTNALAAGGTITATAPAGTVFQAGGVIHDVNTNQTFAVSGVVSGGGVTETLTLSGGEVINASDHVTVTLTNVTNAPTSMGNTLSLSSSTDTTAVQTPSYTLTNPQTPTAPSVSLSSNAGGIQHVTYTIGFTTGAATGELVAPGTITIAAPAGTAFQAGGVIHDITTNQTFAVGGTLSNGNATDTLTLGGSEVINSGDQVSVTLSNVTNPATSANNVIALSTSSDTNVTRTSNYVLTSPQVVTSPSVALSSNAGGIQHVTYTVGFTAGNATGELVAPGTVTIAAPAGTAFQAGGLIHDVNTNQTFAVGGTLSNGNATDTLALGGNEVINSGDAVTVTLSNATNAATGANNTLSISTSSDPSAVTSPNYALTSPQAVTSPSVALTSTAGGIQHVTYTVGFTAGNATGELVAPGTVTIAAPAGTAFQAGGLIHDVNTNQTFAVGGTLSNGNATDTLALGGNEVINSGDAVTVTLANVTSPAVGSGYSVSVSTSSDPSPVATSTFALTTPQGLSNPTPVTLTNSTGGATGVMYTFGFTTSSTGKLVAPGTITVTGPAGTVFPAGGVIHDVTTNQTFAVGGTVSNGGATDTLILGGGEVIQAGDAVSITLSNVTNSPGDTHPLTLSTSSDTGTATSSGTVVNNPPPVQPPVTPPVVPAAVPPPVIGTTGNVAPEGGTVLIKLPAGAKPRAFGLSAAAATGFVPLTAVRSVPVGSTLDTTHGKVGLTMATSKSGGSQTGHFSQGLFIFTQAKSNALTTVSMTGGGLNACGLKLPSGGAAKVTAASTRRRSLLSNVRGRFRTRGRNSAATVRGTQFLTKDTCAGTLTTVQKGIVVVRDFTLRKNVTLKAHHKYLARPPKRH
jgi:hypothetical protein